MSVFKLLMKLVIRFSVIIMDLWIDKIVFNIIGELFNFNWYICYLFLIIVKY